MMSEGALNNRAKRSSNPRVTKAQIRQVVDIAIEAGIKIGGIEVRPDGTIRVLSETLAADRPRNAYDEMKRRQAEAKGG